MCFIWSVVAMNRLRLIHDLFGTHQIFALEQMAMVYLSGKPFLGQSCWFVVAETPSCPWLVLDSARPGAGFGGPAQGHGPHKDGLWR